jgi:hypothetical protein
MQNVDPFVRPTSYDKVSEGAADALGLRRQKVLFLNVVRHFCQGPS